MLYDAVFYQFYYFNCNIDQYYSILQLRSVSLNLQICIYAVHFSIWMLLFRFFHRLGLIFILWWFSSYHTMPYRNRCNLYSSSTATQTSYSDPVIRQYIDKFSAMAAPLGPYWTNTLTHTHIHTPSA